MRVLLDENIDPRLVPLLVGHEVDSVILLGWRSVVNGELLMRARQSYDALITLDKGIAYQHSHAGHDLRIAVVRVLSSTFEQVSLKAEPICAWLASAPPGCVEEIS